MTVCEAINKTKTLYPNTYGEDVLREYLYKLDLNIKQNIIDKYKEGENISLTPYDENTVLLVDEPYTDVYVFWLQAWIDYWNGDYDKYNSSIAMYSAVYDAFAAQYHNNHTPLKNKLKFW